MEMFTMYNKQDNTIVSITWEAMDKYDKRLWEIVPNIAFDTAPIAVLTSKGIRVVPIHTLSHLGGCVTDPLTDVNTSSLERGTDHGKKRE